MTEFWQNCWQNRQTPWDLGSFHPLLPNLWQLVRQFYPQKKFVSALVPGCGRGHDAAWLTRVISRVTMSDLVSEAISEAKKLYGDNPQLVFLEQNALKAHPLESGPFDLIYDRAMLCALPDKLRGQYISSCYDSLTVKGVFTGIIFSSVETDQGPPFALSPASLLQLFAEPFWQPLFMEEHKDGAVNDFILQENLIAFVKV